MLIGVIKHLKKATPESACMTGEVLLIADLSELSSLSEVATVVVNSKMDAA